MSSLVRCLPTYVKDTNHALHIFDSFRFDNSDLEQYLLFIMDVKSLYTVIPNNCGLQALTYFLETRNVKVPSSLIRLAKLVLTLNAFSFNNVHHCQIGHVVMGGKMGPNYACLFIGYIEHQILNSTQALFGNYLCRRYIDDIVGTPSCRREELEAFINFVANFHPALQFTSTISEIEVPFWTTPYKFPILKFRSLSTTKTLTLTTTSIFLLSILNTAKFAVSPPVSPLL